MNLTASFDSVSSFTKSLIAFKDLVDSTFANFRARVLKPESISDDILKTTITITLTSGYFSNKIFQPPKKITPEGYKILEKVWAFIRLHEDGETKASEIVYQYKDTLFIEVQVSYSYVSIYLIIKPQSDNPLFKTVAAVLATDDEGALIKEVGNTILNFIDTGWRGFPPIYNENFTFSKHPFIFLKQGSSTIFVPTITENGIKELRKTFSEYHSFPENLILTFDRASRNLVYTNSARDVSCLSLANATPLTKDDYNRYLNKPVTALFDRTEGGMASDYDWFTRNLDTFGKYLGLFNNTPPGVLSRSVNKTLKTNVDFPEALTTIGDVIYTHKKAFMKFTEDIYNVVRSKEGYISVENYVKALGAAHVLETLANKAVEIKTQVIAERAAFDSVTSRDAPPLPNFNPDISLFPHQAEALAKLNAAGQNAIIDLSTGLGKTVVIIMDILNLLNQGKIKRPLIVMPGSLIAQWVNQINFFSKGKVNAFPITSDVVREHTQEKLEGMIARAPVNTIFLTTFSYLATGPYIIDEVADIESYAGAEWVKRVVHPDLVSIDEAHYIKKLSTQANKACNIVAFDSKYKRIATGTLISNKPQDLIGQCGFLDPAIVGTEAEFATRYGKGKYLLPGFAAKCRDDLRNNAKYIMYRRKDQAPLLPKVHYSEYFVDMTSTQAKLYRAMVTDLMYEIEDDPALASAWNDLMSSPEDSYDIPAKLLGKFARLEQYLTAPEVNKVTSTVKDGEAAPAYISPKLEKIDELIAQSVKQKSKVIIATHYKEAARHLFKYSKFGEKSKRGIYYDAAHKDSILAFKDNPNIVALFSVQNSLKEGLNLQFCNRVIIADVDWTPGNLEQLEARIYRPNLRWENGKAINLNENKDIYIDTVLCNESADVIKFLYQNAKKINNAKIMENCPVDPLIPPRLSKDTLTVSISSYEVDGEENLKRIKNYQKWASDEVEEARAKGNLKYYKPVVAEDLPNSGIIPGIPWVVGMDLPTQGNEISVLDYAETFPEFVESKDLSLLRDKLTGKVVRTAYGYGVIETITGRKSESGISGKVKVKVFPNQVMTLNPYVVILDPSLTPAQAKKLQAENKLAAPQVNKPVPEQTKPAPVVPDKESIADEKDENFVARGKVTLAKLNKMLEPLGVQVTQKNTVNGPVVQIYHPEKKLRVNVTNIKDVSDISYKKWEELANAFLGKFIYKNGNPVPTPAPVDRVKDIDQENIKLPKKSTLDSITQLCDSLGVELATTQVAKEFNFRFVDKESGITSKVIRSVRKVNDIPPAEWLKRILYFKKKVQEKLISQQKMTPDAPTETPPPPKPEPVKETPPVVVPPAPAPTEPPAKANESDGISEYKKFFTSPVVILDPPEVKPGTVIPPIDEIVPPPPGIADQKSKKRGTSTEAPTPTPTSVKPPRSKQSAPAEKPVEPTKSKQSQTQTPVTPSAPTSVKPPKSKSKQSQTPPASLNPVTPPVKPAKQTKPVEPVVEDNNSDEEEILPKLSVGTYNGVLTIFAHHISDEIVDFEFVPIPDTWVWHVPNKERGYSKLVSLQKAFTIPDKNISDIDTVLSNMTQNVYPYAFPKGVSNWLRTTNKKVSKGTLRIYPMVVDGRVYLVVNAKAHPGVNLTKYKFTHDDEGYAHFCTNKEDFRDTLKDVCENFPIDNYDELKKIAKKEFKISL